MRIPGLFLAILVTTCALADTPCLCDPAHPETLNPRQCSLCMEAEKQPADVPVFFLKDANPRKANRMLALPRKHTAGLHHMADLTDAERTALWTAAIEKARSTWGADWAVAYNGERVRTQCHLHIHLGKLLPGVEAGSFVEISAMDQIPSPGSEGLWIHPSESGKMHVHTGEQITETVLLR